MGELREALGERAPRPMKPGGADHVSITRKRALLLGVAGLLSASALFAIVILVVGRFGSVEGRILASTALLAAYGLVALPAVVLLDQDRSRTLARSAAALAAVA